jgi:hypothetical protein
MEAILRKPVILSSVKDVIAAEFGRLFGRGMLAFSEKALFQDSYVQVG